MKPKREFNTVLLEALDEALKSILGESGKEVVYYYLKKHYTIRKDDIPENPELFTEFLNKLFGSGAKIIENAALKNLCLKLGIKYEEVKNAKLADFMREITQENKK